VASWVKGIAAQWAEGPSGLDQLGPPVDQGRHLLPGRPEAGDATGFHWIPLFVNFGHLLRDQDDLVGLSVVVDPERADRPFRQHRLLELERLLGWQLPDRREVLQKFGQQLRKGADLLFFNLQGHELVSLPGLQVEGPFSNRTDGPHGEPLYRREVERLAHDDLRSDRAPVELTVKITGPVR